MNHFEQGLAALMSRQFLEAQVHFDHIANAIPPGEELKYFESVYQCQKILNPNEAWKVLRKIIQLKKNENDARALVELLNGEKDTIPADHLEFYYESKANIHFGLGELVTSQENAIKHVNLLFKKKIYHQLEIAVENYQRKYPLSIYFKFIELECSIVTENIEKQNRSVQSIIELLHRKWGKLDDVKDASKTDLLATAKEMLESADLGNGKNVLSLHYIHLHTLLSKKEFLKKDEWKKLLELLVYDDSWRNGKLAIELALMNNEEEIAQAMLKHMKSKKGFSLVKLTKYDNSLKQWAMAKKKLNEDEKPNEIKLSDDDIKLDASLVVNNKQPTELKFDDEDDDQKLIEINAIKQLMMTSPGWETLADQVITYKALQFNRVVSWLIEYAESKLEAPEIFHKKIKYLKVIHLLDLNQKFMALAVLEEMLGSSTLVMNEFVELKYVQGTIYQSLGENSKARQSFYDVSKIDSEYRQIRERIKQLETN